MDKYVHKVISAVRPIQYGMLATIEALLVQ